MSVATSSSPTAGCAIPKESFHRLGQYLSASDIGTSNTLCERFQDEDSNITSDVESDVAAADTGISVQDPHMNTLKVGINRSESQNDSMSHISVDLGSMDSPEEKSRFYDISLSVDQGDRDPNVEFLTDSNDQEVERIGIHARTHRDRMVLTEDHFNSTGSRMRVGADGDSGEEEGVSVSDDDECILRASRLSNLSICTATHDVDVLLKRRADQLAADNENKGILRSNSAEEDAEGSVVSDMEEEYFMGYSHSHSDAPTPSDVLAMSLYSDCGVPLRAITRRRA